MSQSPSVLAGPLAALFPMLTSACFIAFAFAWISPDYISADLIISLSFAQPLLSVMLLVYAESLKHEASPLHRVGFFLFCGLVLAGGFLLAEPRLWELYTHPNILLAVLWAAMGLIINILLMRDSERIVASLRAGAQAQDGFELWGLVFMAAIIVGVLLLIVEQTVHPDIDLTPSMFALVPAFYFAAYAACVWRTYRPKFLDDPKPWVEAPWIRRIYRFLRVSGPPQPH